MKTTRLLLASLVAACGFSSLPAFAQPQDFQLNLDRVRQGFTTGLAGTKTIFIPTVYLKVSVMGDVWAQQKSNMFMQKSLNAQARGRFYVKGLDKPMAQELAGKVQADLVKKLKDAGFTVLTWDDMKDHPFLVAYDRQKPEEPWNMPVASGKPLSFAVVTPSDAQAFEIPSLTSIAFKMQSLAKEENFVILVPEISYSVPQMWGETSSGYKRVEAGINTDPAMKMHWVNVWGVNPKGDQMWAMIQEHGTRLAAQKTGVAEKMSEVNTDFGSKAWTRTSADWLFTLDPQAFSEGVLRVGYAVNGYIATEMTKAMNK